MITRSPSTLTSLCVSLALSCRLLQYQYVRKKQIDQICAPYINSSSTMDKIKMYGKMFAHIGKKGFAGAYNDIALYKQLASKPKEQYTSQDWNQLIRIYHDFFRLGPLVIIQILPMSGPLFVLYMYTYPGSIPSWFIIDKFHEDYQKKIRVKQLQAIEYFRSKSIKSKDINFDAMSLQQARKLAQCLYGYHRDGTQGYNKIFKKDIEYIISQSFSKYLIKRKLKYKFNSDLENQNVLKDKTFDQKIKWKYQQVMEHGKLLKNYQDMLSPEELKIRKQYAEEESKMDAQGSHTVLEDKNKDNENNTSNGNGNGTNSNDKNKDK